MTGRDNGAVATIVALCVAFVFIPLLAVTVDVGRVLVSRSAVQNAADHAAMAAAWASCDGEDPVAAATASAGRNGFSDDEVEVVDRGQGSLGVVVSHGVDGVFSPVVGVETVPVSARAAASCSSEPITAPVIYAHSTCQESLAWAGNENHVSGAVHTNGRLAVTGNLNVQSGTATYSGSIYSAGNQNTWSPATPSQVPARTWPLTLDVNDFDNGGRYTTRPDYVSAPGTTTISAQWLRQKGHLIGTALAPKIYYTDGRVDISDIGITGTATFVARGDITFSGVNISVQPHFANISAFSAKGTGGCGTDGVRLIGNYVSLAGIVHAPRGNVYLAGNYNRIDGTVIANQITLYGNRLTINTGVGATIPGTPRIALDAWDD
ncbi:hypothetical protein FKR81_17145 [Lentzea tibetensis]|uniref:Putative Flp pilus-assembly TadG-like N-terminal domain-containing protein n=1 Tax=Lentzea tibetensis TaxID=2591470 RepID=A0A563EUK2_9PSEU|nr:pilus assembly protein TadG-related protein [Lentzea tibetensis]TWP51333.1 hypothetical protein FKR81_17145 [Lentzea tibetensis]